MTRRKLIRQLTQIGSIIAAGVFIFARRALAQKLKLRKFVRAVPVKRYPGRVKSRQDIFEQSKWSG